MDEIESATHVTELYNITIAYDDVSGDYLGAIYCCQDQEQGGVRNKNLYKVLQTISKRIKDKEKQRRFFPVPKEEPSLIVLPNGR